MREALVRELREELGIECTRAEPIMTLTHEYPDRVVDLRVVARDRSRGEPQGLDGQQLKWVDCRVARRRTPAAGRSPVHRSIAVVIIRPRLN